MVQAIQVHATDQVYASYKYRRDLAEAVKSADAYDRAREVSDDENAYQEVLAGKHSSDSVPLDPPTMRQAIAWELALRSIRQQEVRRPPFQVAAPQLAML